MNFILAVILIVYANVFIPDPCDTIPEGIGILNYVEITDVNGIDNTPDILAFQAFIEDPNTSKIHFLFEFINVPHETAFSPSLSIYDNNDFAIGVFPNVMLDTTGVIRKTPYNLIEFVVTPRFVRNSHLGIQMRPNTVKLVSYRVNLTAATLVQSKGDDLLMRPLGEVLPSLLKK